MPFLNLTDSKVTESVLFGFMAALLTFFLERNLSGFMKDTTNGCLDSPSLQYSTSETAIGKATVTGSPGFSDEVKQALFANSVGSFPVIAAPSALLGLAS